MAKIKIPANAPVLVLTLRKVNGKSVANGYSSTYERVFDWFHRHKNPREAGFLMINVYVNTQNGHEMFGWNAAEDMIKPWSFDFQLNFREFYRDWVNFWEDKHK